MMTMGESTWVVFILSLCLLPSVMCANCIKDISSIADMLKTEACPSIRAKPYFSHIYFKDGELYIGSSNSLYNVDPIDFKVVSKQCIDPFVTKPGSIPCTDIVPANDISFVCQNQISVIEKFNDSGWLVCGTNSLKPACWKCDSTQTEWNCTRTSYDANVERFAPRRPDHDSTWYFNRTSGLIFAGTEVKVHKMPYFSRLDSNYEGADFLNQRVYTKANHENWLNTPAFVGKPIHRGEYIYFFFRETATEYKNAGKIIYPRVGRVCAQNLETGKVSRLDDYFQTFVKARLNCSIALDFPFYFNEIQDIDFEGDTPDIVYAVFTTPSEGPPASAVCAYSMSEIEELFDVIGKYKGQTSSDADWLPSSYDQLGANERFGTCGHKYILDVIGRLDSHNLIDQLVPNLRNVKVPHVLNGQLRESDSPLLYYNTYRFSSIVKVDEGDEKDPIVFMIGTSNMKILKATYNPSMGGDEYGSIITEIMMNGNETQNVQDMIKVSQANKTYVIVTAISDVFKLQVEFCNVYLTCEECLRVKDPHCQWHKSSHSCYYNGSLVSSHQSVPEACVISRGSNDIDQVKSFRDSQRYSSQGIHTLNFYALLVAEKGSNIHMDLDGVNCTMWNCELSKGVTSNTEFSALRLTLQNGEKEPPQNVNISIQTDAKKNCMFLNTTVIIDDSDIPSKNKIKEIFGYDSELARYEYSVKQIRQRILQTCSESHENGNNVLTCPGYRFQEDNDSFTCPKKALF